MNKREPGMKREDRDFNKEREKEEEPEEKKKRRMKIFREEEQ
jgi:hypothetical protein